MKRLITSTLALGLTALCLWQADANASPVVQIQTGQTSGTTGITGTNGSRDDSERPITLNVVNQPPQCCIGPNCIHTGLVMIKKSEGLTTTFDLDASMSYDPEGQPLTFQWTACAGAYIADPTSPVTTITLDTSVNGDQVCAVRLKVGDGVTNAFCRVYVETVAADAICPSKPAAIEWVYVGGDCSESNYIQSPAGVSCSGDPGIANPVRIVMTHNTQPSRVYFDGIVSLGETFTELGSAGHKNGKVPPNTRVQIFDLAGNLLQESDFHTSCSQPLEVGDRFGAVIITGYTP